MHTERKRWNPGLWELIAIIILVNFLVYRKTRRGNCLLLPRTSYALAYLADVQTVVKVRGPGGLSHGTWLPFEPPATV